MRICINLSFNGQCGDAFAFYEKALGGKIGSVMTYAGSPMEKDVPAEWRDKVMIADMRIGDMTIMGSDSPPGYYRGTPQGYDVVLIVDDPAEARRLWDALSEGGTPQMPLAETFWSPAFGMCADRYGTQWMINCEPEESAA